MRKNKDIIECKIWIGIVLGILSFSIYCGAFERTPEEIIKAIYSDDEKVTSGLSELFCESSESLDKDTLIPLLTNILLKDKDEEVRVKTTGLLACLQDVRVVLPITKALQDNSARVRMHAAMALGDLTRYTGKKKICQAAVPELIKALNDTDSWVRTWAANSLGYIGDPTAIPKLIEQLTDQDLYVRSSSIRSLGKIGEKSVVPVLLERLDDREKDIRKAGIYALGELGETSTVPLLIDMLADEDWKIRKEAVHALEKIGDPRAIPSLKQLAAEDPYSKELEADDIAISLGLGEKRGEKFVIYPVRQAAKRALEKLGRRNGHTGQ